MDEPISTGVIRRHATWWSEVVAAPACGNGGVLYPGLCSGCLGVRRACATWVCKAYAALLLMIEMRVGGDPCARIHLIDMDAFACVWDCGFAWTQELDRDPCASEVRVCAVRVRAVV